MEQIWVCQNSYGFRAIWTQIFFQRKIYLNRSSAQESHQKSLKSCLKTLYDVLNDMTEEFFVCQKSYGNTTQFNFFCTQKKYSVTGSGTFGRTDQFFFRYDQRSSDMIRSDWKKIIFVKSLMGRKLESIFFMHKIDRKDASYGLVSVTTHYNYIKW